MLLIRARRYLGTVSRRLGPGMRRAGEVAWRRKGRIAFGGGVLLLTALMLVSAWAWKTATRLELGRLAEPSFVYAAGQIVSPGLSVTASNLVGTLVRLGYQEVTDEPHRAGQFRRGVSELDIFLHERDDPQARRPAVRVRLELEGDRIEAVVNLADGRRLDGVELEPEPLGELGDAANRLRRPVRLAAVPRNLIDAVLAVEDRRFFQHAGLDVRAIFRAVRVNLSRGKVEQGASTITQQLVKNLDVRAGRSWVRKLREAALALAVERRYRKTDILEAYLNTVYLGHWGPVGIYGVGTASRLYFGHPVEELDLAEAAVLAGMMRAPNKYSPVTHPDRALVRRDVVLRRMLDLGLIDQTAFARATRQAARVEAVPPRPLLGPYFFDLVYAQLERIQPRPWGPPGGLRVYTTLNPVLQHAAETVVARNLASLEDRFPNLRGLGPARRLQGALVALDPSTGGILALVGGRDYELSQFDRATQARRHPGSTFKPFVFLAGLRHGPHGEPPRLTAASVLEDAPVTVRVGNENWTPRNAARFFLGRVTVRRTLELSLNSATVWAAERLGLDTVIRTARDVGFTSPIAPLPTLALGAFEVTPLELAGAYATVADAGKPVQVTPIRAIVDGEGTDISPVRQRGAAGVRAEEAFILTYILRGVIERGTAAMARVFGVEGPIAGKTGSTDRDAWFVGYTPRLVTVVWVGADERPAVSLTGARFALPIWADFMRTAMAVLPTGPFPVPSAVVFRDVDPSNGKLATRSCPLVFREAFLPSAAPTKVCTEHGGAPDQLWEDVTKASPATLNRTVQRLEARSEPTATRSIP